MEEPKTLSYDWQYGREELFLRVDSYMSDDNLYIGLYHMEDGYPESFADLTVNLPFAPLGGILSCIKTKCNLSFAALFEFAGFSSLFFAFLKNFIMFSNIYFYPSKF